jgi:hypothetical protein
MGSRDLAQSSGKQKNIGLDTGPVRNSIIRFLNNNVQNINEEYEIIARQESLDEIVQNEYILCPRMTGTRTWIIFFIKDNIHYAVNFPKHNQAKREQTRIYPIQVPAAGSYYRGTIMEGIYYRDETSQYLFVDEVHLLEGVNQMTKMKDIRLRELNESLRRSVNNSPNYGLYASQYYFPTEESLTALYEKIKVDPLIRELIFYPRIYGKKIYSYPISDQDILDQSVTYDIFKMRKGNHVDSYYLQALNGENIGLAYIPNINVSRMCKKWFKDYRKKILMVRCSLGSVNVESDKWVPVKLVEEEEIQEDDNAEAEDLSQNDNDTEEISDIDE